MIRIGQWKEGRLIVRFPYSPERVAKIKTVPGRQWHGEEKCWSVPQAPDAAVRRMGAQERRKLDPLA